jgi:hypothetical protein
LSQNAGAVCELPESETSTFWPTFCADRPTCCSAVRSICRLTAGASKRWCTCTSTAPGICRIFFTSSAASLAFSAIALPVNWTSIADGRPKLRIWVTMSAGWKKNSTPGKRFGSSRLQDVTNSSVGRWPFLSDSRISPSSVPKVPALLYERLMPLFGTPRLSRHGLELVLRHELADRRLDVVGEARRLLDPGAGGGAQVQADLAGVDGGEEVAAEHRIEAAGEQAEGEESRCPNDAALGEQRAEQRGVGGADALELAVEGAIDALQRARPRARLRRAVAVRAAHAAASPASAPGVRDRM